MSTLYTFQKSHVPDQAYWSNAYSTMCIETSIQFNLPFLEPNQKADKQQLCNFPEALANVRFRVEFFLRVIIGAIEHFFYSRIQYDGNKKVPDCRRKATRLRETVALPSCSHQIKEIYSTMTSRSDNGV